MSLSPFDGLKPITPDYAMLPILEGFNWSECLAEVGAAQLYLVVFRSVRRETGDPVRLLTFDDRAYAEALKASGLLFYFRGGLNERRQCLSFCLWESQERAQAATAQPAHAAAADITDEMYDSFELERWILTKRSESDELEIEPAAGDTPWYYRFTPIGSQRRDTSRLVVDSAGRSPVPGSDTGVHRRSEAAG